jgi:ubiquinone/menaquinone biosynthesis C-methylase UbiE
MGLYQKHILPGLVNRVCRSGQITDQREKIVPRASGRVLEIGMGSGLNLPFYDFQKINSLLGLEPSGKMIAMAKEQAQRLKIDVEFLKTTAIEIPLTANSIDSVVVTYTLCTIPDVLLSLGEMNRVLKPGGKLYFSEHGQAPERSVQYWQNTLTPIWKIIGGGCHLNRMIPELILKGGFRIQEMETLYLPGWKPLTFNFWGIAVKD